MKHLKIFLSVFLTVLSLEGYSQMGITSYSIYSLGINTSQNKRISGELKTFANQAFEDVQMEVDGFYNFKPKTYHRFSIGLGVKFNPFSEHDWVYAFTIPVSIEIFPLQDFKKLSLLFELSPEIFPEDGANLRSLWGIRYTFGE